MRWAAGDSWGGHRIVGLNIFLASFLMASGLGHCLDIGRHASEFFIVSATRTLDRRQNSACLAGFTADFNNIEWEGHVDSRGLVRYEFVSIF